MSDEDEKMQISGFKPIAGYKSPGRKLEPGETIQVYAQPLPMRERVAKLLMRAERHEHEARGEDGVITYCVGCGESAWPLDAPVPHQHDCELAAVLRELEGK